MKKYFYISIACIATSLIAMEKPDYTYNYVQYKYYCNHHDDGSKQYFVTAAKAITDYSSLKQVQECNPIAIKHVLKKQYMNANSLLKNLFAYKRQTLEWSIKRTLLNTTSYAGQIYHIGAN